MPKVKPYYVHFDGGKEPIHLALTRGGTWLLRVTHVAPAPTLEPTARHTNEFEK